MRALKVGSGLWSVVLTTNRVHKVRRTEAFRLPLVALPRRPNTERDEASLLFTAFVCKNVVDNTVLFSLFC